MPSLNILNMTAALTTSMGKELKTFSLDTDGQIQLNAPNPWMQYFLSGRHQRGATAIIHNRQNRSYQCALQSCPTYQN